MKKLLFAFALLFSIPTFAMIETVTPPQYQAVKKPTFFQKLLLKKALKKVDPDKTKWTNGEIFGFVLGIGFIIAGLLITSVTFKITFLLMGLIFTLWVLFQLLKKL